MLTKAIKQKLTMLRKKQKRETPPADLSQATAATIKELREAFAIQKLHEKETK